MDGSEAQLNENYAHYDLELEGVVGDLFINIFGNSVDLYHEGDVMYNMIIAFNNPLHQTNQIIVSICVDDTYISFR